MSNYKQWVVEAFLTGPLYIPKKDKNLPITRGRTNITPYAILEQDLKQREPYKKRILLGLEIQSDSNHGCIAFQELEVFIRTLSIIKNVPLYAYPPIMTKNKKEWPKGIEFLKAKDHKICSTDWQPYMHFKDPKNRVKHNGHSSLAITEDLGEEFLNHHQRFYNLNDYQVGLLKDYLFGLEAENRQPSLAFLYFFKVIERVGKNKYNDKKTIRSSTMKRILDELEYDFSEDQLRIANFIPRNRHTKSEAHLMDEGMPSDEELRVCRLVSYLLIQKELVKI